uniref:C1q domain-containing protein n=1 Tax=Magallana gigas TaxID=29159 RepID=A0A8W8LMJ7_MAGGI
MLSLPFLVAVAANETPQQVVTKYNNYKAICNGLGYKNLGCKDTSTIAFQSSLTNNLNNMKNHETVVFDKVSVNEGKAYDSSSGIFTAPLDGTYSFTWTTLTTGGKYFISEIMQNGKVITKNYTDGRGRDGYEMSTSHANIKMKKGDKVWIRTYGNLGQHAVGGHWCYFSGLKL